MYVTLELLIIPKMKTFSINTLGCKVNQYESQQIIELLRRHGMTAATENQHIDLVVVNTCCVTHIASAKSRRTIRRAQKLSPKARILVTGCLPAGPTEELKNFNSDAFILCDRSQLASAIDDLLTATAGDATSTSSNKPVSSAKIKEKNALSSPDIYPALPTLTSYSGQTRAFLKIQDGCDGYCTYCIVPQIRTKVCNKSVKTALAEATCLVESGHKEIVLTGVFLGAYGHETVRRTQWDPAKSDALADLIEQIAQIPGLERVRLSSLEPGDVTDRLIDVFCRNSGIAPHLHLPLQSGSDRILGRMCRQYGVDDFLSAVSLLRRRLDRPAVTTDIIAGFPGETEDDFDCTRRLMEEIGFAKSHIFPFSPRRGTAAARMQNKVKPEIIRRRTQILRNLDARLQQQYRQQFKGSPARVIIEETDPPRGRCERYFLVEASDSPRVRIGDVVTATVN